MSYELWLYELSYGYWIRGIDVESIIIFNLLLYLEFKFK